RETLIVDALAAQGLFEHPADGAVIIDDPDGIHGGCTILVRSGEASAAVGNRQQEGETGVAGSAVHVDHPLMLLHEALCDRQPESAAAVTPRDQRIEDLVEDLVRDAGA